LICREKDGRRLVAWRPGREDLMPFLGPIDERTTLAAVDPTGSVLATAAGAQVTIWDAATGEPRLTIRPGTLFDGVHAIRFSQDGQRVLLGGRSLGLYDVNRATELLRLDDDASAAVLSARFDTGGVGSPGGDEVVAVNDRGWVKRWRSERPAGGVR
jgi:WD40 repeat protein